MEGKLFFSTVCAALVCASSLWAAIYVDCNAAAGGDGSEGSPFQTLPEGVAAAVAGDPLVLVAEGTYTLSALLTIDSGITVRGAGMDRTVISGGGKVRGLSIGGNATVENLTVTDCYSSTKVSGIGVAISSGVLSNCRIANCSNAAHDTTGVCVYLSGTALVTGCVIEKATASKRTSGYGAYLNGASTILEGTLVTGCTTPRSVTTNLGTVYVKAGTVRNCTIVGNKLVANSGLYLANSADAKAYDTIVWGNEDWDDADPLAPDLSVGAMATVERICAPVAAPQDPYPITDDPCFVNAAQGDYTLRSSSPCITPQVGAFAFDTTVPSYGLAAARLTGVDSLETTLSVICRGGADVAAVAWTVDGQPAGTSEELTWTFSPGFHSVSATVTPSEGAPVTVTETDFVKVYASELYVDVQSADPVAPYTTPATAAATFDAAYPLLATNGTLHIAAGTYMLANEYHIRTPQKILGENRETTILKPLSGGYRHFNLCHAGALLAGVKVTGGVTGTSRYGSALYIAAGVVSNCWVTGNSLAAGNLHGGAMYIAGADAHLTRSLITENKITGGSGCKGMGVYMTNGTIDNCLFTNNTATAGNKSGFLGGGINMSGGKVLNCTFAGNACGKGPGVYADGGTVANTIIYGNTLLGSGDPNWFCDKTAVFVNCCSLNAIGSDCVTVTDAPYTGDYTLASGSPCIDGGDSAYLGDESAADYFGEERLLGDSVDIGASEYRPSATMSATVICSPQAAVVGDAIVFRASVEGAGVTPELCTCAWTIDGAPVAEVGLEFTNTLAIGQHVVELSVTCGGQHAIAEPATALVFPETVYVAEGAAPEFPYDTRATAFTNVAEAVATALSGMTIHICEGDWRIYNTIVLNSDKNLQIVGDGMDKTTIYRSGGDAFRLVEMNADGSRLADLALTGGSAAGGGVYAHDNGGIIERCRIYGCSSAVNSDGGGVSLSGRAAVIRQSVISNNTAVISTGQMRGGGGVKLNDGAVCESCLIIDNLAQSGAGVLLGLSGANRLSNCTLIGNHCQSNRTDCVSSAVFVQSGTVENCIVLGSYDNTGSANPHVAGEETCFFNCFLPLNYGEGCVVGDGTTVGFRDGDGGDYRLTSSSPCRNSGRMVEGMDDALDFYGQRRVFGKCIDIGAAECQLSLGTAFFIQ